MDLRTAILASLFFLQSGELTLAENESSDSPNSPKIELGSFTALLEQAFQNVRATQHLFPSDKNFILYLGLSNSIEASMHSAIDPLFSNRARSVPVTHLIDIEVMDAVAADRLIERILPPRSVLGNRDIVINRVLWEGNTMRLFIPRFLKHLERWGYPNQISLNLTVADQNTEFFLREFFKELPLAHRFRTLRFNVIPEYAKALRKRNMGSSTTPDRVTAFSLQSPVHARVLASDQFNMASLTAESPMYHQVSPIIERHVNSRLRQVRCMENLDALGSD